MEYPGERSCAEPQDALVEEKESAGILRFLTYFRFVAVFCIYCSFGKNSGLIRNSTSHDVPLRTSDPNYVWALTAACIPQGLRLAVRHGRFVQHPHLVEVLTCRPHPTPT